MSHSDRNCFHCGRRMPLYVAAQHLVRAKPGISKADLAKALDTNQAGIRIVLGRFQGPFLVVGDRVYPHDYDAGKIVNGEG